MAVANVALPAVPRMTHAAKNDAGPVELDSRTKPGAATMVPAIITRRAPNRMNALARTGADKPVAT